MVSQEEATRLGAPVLEGCEIDCDCKGIDVLPLLSPTSVDSRLGPQQRLKLNGSAKFAGRVTPAPESAGGAAELAAPSFSGDPALQGFECPPWQPCSGPVTITRRACAGEGEGLVQPGVCAIVTSTLACSYVTADSELF